MDAPGLRKENRLQLLALAAKLGEDILHVLASGFTSAKVESEREGQRDRTKGQPEKARLMIEPLLGWIFGLSWVPSAFL